MPYDLPFTVWENGRVLVLFSIDKRNFNSPLDSNAKYWNFPSSSGGEMLTQGILKIFLRLTTREEHYI